MGLLDFLSSDDARLGIGLLAAGGYQPTKMTSAQRIAQALQGESARKQEAAKALLLNAQLEQLKSDTDFQRQQRPFLLTQAEAKAREAKTEADILAAYHTAKFGSGGPPSGISVTGGMSAPQASGGAPGLLSDASGVPSTYGITANTAGNALALPPDVELGLLHPRTKDLAKAQADRIKLTDKMRELIGAGIQPGSPQWNAALSTLATQGGLWQPAPGGGYQIDPGFVAGARDVKRAESEEGARVKPFERKPSYPGDYPTVTNELEAARGFQQTAPAIARPELPVATNRSFPATSADAYRRTPEYAALTPQERANFDMVAAREQLGQVTTTDQNIGPRRSAPMIGVLPRSAVPPNAAGMTPEDVTAQKAKEAGLTKKTELDAVRIDDVEKKLPSLYSTLSRLDKMEALTKDDKTFAAAGAELKSDLGRIAQAFGLKVMPEKTANTEAYMAHVAELLKERLASKDYGAGTGISNLDLVAAGRPLPQVMNTVGGRLKIINALREDARRSISDIEAASDYFDKNKTMSGFRYPSADDPNRVIEMRRTKDGRVLIKRASGLIEAMK